MAGANTLRSEKKADESHWIPISDLMSVLMMIFLFIAISYMRHINQSKERIEEIAVTYNKLQKDLYNDLHNEFESDLEKWNAVIDEKTLSVKFQSPEILFGQGSARLNRQFKVILDDFFPRYINILTSKNYIEDIEEIRIEGHTSSEWARGVNSDVAYFQNMSLSQNRTRAVLKYALERPELSDQTVWLQSKVTANGLSSSRPVLNGKGKEDRNLSRRVEFRVRTNAEDRIVRILEAR